MSLKELLDSYSNTIDNYKWDADNIRDCYSDVLYLNESDGSNVLFSDINKF